MKKSRAAILPANGRDSIDWAVERLLGGGVIVFPTDTVYGMAASLHHPDQLERIYKIKGRDDAKPLPVLVSSSGAARELASELTQEQELFLDRYWPGPLTVVVRASQSLPARVKSSDGTVGLRAPNHPLALVIIERAGGSIACTSANRSGDPPAITAQEAETALGADVDVILDGGAAPGGIASTVVGFIGDDLHVYREGPIPLEHLQATWAETRAGIR